MIDANERIAHRAGSQKAARARTSASSAASLSVQLRICILIARRCFDRRDLMKSFQLKHKVVVPRDARSEEARKNDNITPYSLFFFLKLHVEVCAEQAR